MTRHDCLRSTVSFLISKAASCPDVFTNANESLDVSFSEYFAEGGVEGHSVMFVTFSQQDDLLWVCLSTHPTKQQNPSMKGEKKNPPVYMWVSDFVEENPWFQNEPLADVGRVSSPPRAGRDPLRLSSMWHKLNLSWRFLGNCFLSATQSVYPGGGKHPAFLVQKVKGNT